MPRKKINLKIDDDFKSKIYNLPLGLKWFVTVVGGSRNTVPNAN